MGTKVQLVQNSWGKECPWERQSSIHVHILPYVVSIDFWQYKVEVEVVMY